MANNYSKTKKISIIGIIPQYPKHSQHNIYANIKMPPVGIISILSQIDGFKKIYAIDENNYAGPRDFMDMPDHTFLQERNPADIAMFYGGMSNSIPRMFSVARQYKGFGAITIAGGSHVDALPEEALDSGIDIVVHGEGEETTQEILETIVRNEEVKLDKKGLSNIKGISILDENKEYLFTGKREPIKNLDKLKDVDLDLIKFLEKKWSSIPVSRGRGCNWNCEFCVVHNQYGPYKASSIEKPLRQIIKHSKKGHKSFFITDDNFAQNIEETIELCKRIGDYNIKRKFWKKIKFTVQVRSEITENDKLIEAMRYAGVKTLAIGYESPIDEELKAMKKGVRVEKLIERSRKLSKYFYLHGMFMFGYPTGSKSDLTLEQRARGYTKFFKDAKIDTVQVLNVVPIPGTELRAKLEVEDRILPMVGWDRYDGQFLCYDPTKEGFDPYELQNLPRMLMKKWYLGNFMSRNLNYGNWMNWAYNVFGFPMQYGVFYTKRFVHNIDEKRREKNIERESLLPKRNIFYEPLVNAWKLDIMRRWRNLTIKTYGGGIVKRWFKEYKKSDYMEILNKLFTKTQN